MEWMQVGAILGGAFTFYQMSKNDIKGIKDDIKKEIDIIRKQTNTMDENHRADMKAMDDKWAKLFENMDSKWERLFEKFLDGKRQA